MFRKYLPWILVSVSLLGVLAAVIFYGRGFLRDVGGLTPSATVPVTTPVVAGKIVIQGFQFIPARYSVKKGEKVTWKNLDTVPHTVTAPLLGGQHVLPPGAEFTFPTDELAFSGEISYRCDFHPGMTGVVAVIPEKPATSFLKFYEGLSAEKKECLSRAFGARLNGFLDGTLTAFTTEENAALVQCTK